MSTVQRVNFEPVSDLKQNWLRDLPLADGTLADPSNALALVDGEWVTLNTDYKWVRASDVGQADGTIATQASWPVFFERGRTDRQGMAERKTTAVFMGEWEFDTRIFDASFSSSGAAITTLLMPVKVATITIGSRKYSGLVGHDGTEADLIVGVVTRLPANNGGKLRIRSSYRR